MMMTDLCRSPTPRDAKTHTSMMAPTRSTSALLLLACTSAACAALTTPANAYPYKLVTVQPTYKISDWDAAKPIVDGLVSDAKAETGVAYCGYATSRTERSMSTVGGYKVQAGDELFGRLAFPDADAALKHMALAKAKTDALCAGPVTLADLSIHGPASELDKIRAELEDANFYEIGSGLSRLERETGAMPLPLQLVTLLSTFTVSDAAAATRICDELVERTATESNCIYCGWTRREDELVLREAYGSVIGVARHVENAGDLIESLQSSGAASFGETRLHTSLANMRLFEEFVEDTKRSSGYCGAATRRFFAEGGFSRYEVQQSMFGFFFKR